jgi:hypothetical protein
MPERNNPCSPEGAKRSIEQHYIRFPPFDQSIPGLYGHGEIQSPPKRCAG